jgi:hypothetical protein
MNWTAYVVGYQSRLALERFAEWKKLIERADFYIRAPLGIAIGQKFDITIEQPPDETIPTSFVCVELEHDGKLAILKAL